MVLSEMSLKTSIVLFTARCIHHEVVDDCFRRLKEGSLDLVARSRALNPLLLPLYRLVDNTTHFL